MFAGRDLEQLQMTEFLSALEVADMDLEDAGCPAESDARVMLEELMNMIDSGRERQGFSTTSFLPYAEDVVEAVRSCRHVDNRTAQDVASDLEIALDRAQEVDRY
jgi:hypothetical protein